MLYLIGLGLWDEQDTSLKAIQAMKNCDLIYAEEYTGRWSGFDKLEEIIKKDIHVLDRKKIESDFLLNKALKRNIALLIPGDPLTATTHFQLIIDAKKQGIPVKVIHSSSIYTAVAETGLLIYKFGRTTTLVYPEQGYEPSSPYDVIAENKKAGLHSLVLLDVKVDEKQRKYMSIREGLEELLKMEKIKKAGIINKDTKVIVCCQLGSNEQIIRYDVVSGLIKDAKLEKTPAVLIIPGRLNFKEEEALKIWEKTWKKD